MNKKILMALAAIPLAAMVSLNAQAEFIQTSNSCPGGTGCDATVTDNYGYIFRIDDGLSVDNVFNATLTNTSTSSLSGALIDQLFFNMTPTLTLGTLGNLGVDFQITNISPTWTFSAASGGIQFDYVGDRATPGTRIAPGDSLTFDFTFNSLADINSKYGSSLSSYFDLWRNTNTSTGAGAGGGGDVGQVAVSFQQLGTDGEGSDLLASNWGFTPGPDPDPDPVPEPSTVLLMGLGFLGFGASRLKAKKS